MKSDVWLIGDRGMLGQEVAKRLSRESLTVHATDLDCDITRLDDVIETATTVRPRWIVNCSAYTAVDKAEEEEERAHSINALGAENIGRAAAESGATVVHVSTDYVFDGRSSVPYRPDDLPRPLGAYGRTKLAGEQLLAAATRAHLIIRTAWLYGIGGRNFVSTMLRLMNERDEIRVVADQHGSPTHAPDLADAIVRFIVADHAPYGIYHFTNAGQTTWHGFAQAIHDRARASGLLTSECVVAPIASFEYPTPAKRPAYSVMDSTKISSELRIRIPSWEEGLDKYLEELAHTKQSQA